MTFSDGWRVSRNRGANLRNCMPCTARLRCENAAMLDNAFEWFAGILVAALVGLMGFIGWDAWKDRNSPTFELRRDDWVCTASEQRTHQQPMLVGKTTILMPMTRTVCTAYERR